MDWSGLIDCLELGLGLRSGQIRLGQVLREVLLIKQRVKKMVLTLKEGAWQMDPHSFSF